MPKYLEPTEYRRFTRPYEMQKSINGFRGLLEGISIDGIVDEAEFIELKNWYELHRYLIDRHPFNEILPAIDAALSDRILTFDEVEDLRWLCDQVSSGEYYDLITSSIQTLHGVIHGILANNKVTDAEIANLQVWMDDHSVLKGTYPFDEIYSLVFSVMEDGTITDDERNILIAYFSEFVDTRNSYNLNEIELADLRQSYSVQGVCAKDPDILVIGKTFCFTGASSIATRNEIESIILKHGGLFVNSVSKKVQYLVVGADGTPCWAFSCYGRKIEKAISLRKTGQPIIIVNEHDYWKAIRGSEASECQLQDS